MHTREVMVDAREVTVIEDAIEVMENTRDATAVMVVGDAMAVMAVGDATAVMVEGGGMAVSGVGDGMAVMVVGGAMVVMDTDHIDMAVKGRCRDLYSGSCNSFTE